MTVGKDAMTTTLDAITAGPFHPRSPSGVRAVHDGYTFGAWLPMASSSVPGNIDRMHPSLWQRGYPAYFTKRSSPSQPCIAEVINTKGYNAACLHLPAGRQPGPYDFAQFKRVERNPFLAGKINHHGFGEGIAALIEACPKLETIGIYTGYIGAIPGDWPPVAADDQTAALAHECARWIGAAVANAGNCRVVWIVDALSSVRPSADQSWRHLPGVAAQWGVTFGAEAWHAKTLPVPMAGQPPYVLCIEETSIDDQDPSINNGAAAWAKRPPEVAGEVWPFLVEPSADSDLVRVGKQMERFGSCWLQTSSHVTWDTAMHATRRRSQARTAGGGVL